MFHHHALEKDLVGAGPSSVTTHTAQALEEGSGTSSLGSTGLGSPQVPPRLWDTQPKAGSPSSATLQRDKGTRGWGLLLLSLPTSLLNAALAPSRTSTWNLFPLPTPVLRQECLPFEGILRLCPNRRLGGAGFSWGWNRKPNQTPIRGMAGDPQEFLPGSSTSGSHGEGVPAFPRCYPGLLSQASLQPVPTTEPSSLLPWRNWLDAILRRAGWNSLQIAILSQSAASRSNCASRKSVMEFFFFPFVFLLENERFCGKGLFWIHFSICKN